MSDLINDTTDSIEVASKVRSLPDQEFARDISRGLTANPKYLSSKYFYDKKGDELFQQIMALDEYYLTKAEYSIFNDQKDDILEVFSQGKPFELVELGAGDGYKTKVLLRHFQEANANFKYLPVDISANVLESLASDLEQEMPDLNVSGLRGDYFQVLQDMKKKENVRRVVLFLGSNIGNFKRITAIQFLHQLKAGLDKDDLVMIGFDLKKDPDKIFAAYNDERGVTKAFNLNLLTRINQELDADFNLDNFKHYPYYDPVSGECRSYLLSKCDQVVKINQLNQEVHFKAWEAIHTEISAKFDLDSIKDLATTAGFTIEANFFDKNRWYVDSVWRV
ncbi:MAG: L-histidine N(alpha)-methyltransferase [Cyclobacteriaceae bacterium]